MTIFQAVLGLVAFCAIAWVFSEDRKVVPIRTFAVGIGLQLLLALLLLKAPLFQGVLIGLNDAIVALQDATKAGTSVVFGYLGGGDLPYDEAKPGGSFILAFQALPLVMVMAALSALLWHWRILPILIKGFSAVLEKTMKVNGSVGLAAAANIFGGMIEAALLIRPTLAKLSRADLFVVMTCGMTTIAGTMMALYAFFLKDVVENAAGQLFVASLISAPAAIVISRAMVPAKADSAQISREDLAEMMRSPYASSMDAVVRGIEEGVKLFLTIIASLIVFIALVALANMVLGLLPNMGGEALTLERLLGWIMAPVAWLMGIPAAEVTTAGGLLGVKIVLNELVAYLQLSGVPAEALSDKSRLILVYALCSFANFGSLGIMMGGLVTLIPERRADLVSLGLRTILSGTLATCMTGAVVGIVG